MKKIAIIGASTGQLGLCKKEKEMNLETFCFAWPKDAICKDYVDHFIPISIFDMDKIVKLCKEFQIDGVVSNASEATALVVSYVAEKLGKICTPYQTLLNIQNKEYVRRITNSIQGLGKVNYIVGKSQEIIHEFSIPYVLKPINGAGKKGVNFIDTMTIDSIVLPEDLKDTIFIAEQYIEGKEYSVETISYKNQHEIIQITEKIGTGAPHFVELEHHQPAQLAIEISKKLDELIPDILSSIGYINGAAHIEIKIDSKKNIYLIEVNPRGGGGEISSQLVQLSTGYDYLKAMIEVSIGDFLFSHNKKLSNFAGIYFLCQQTTELLKDFNQIDYQPWLIEKKGSFLNLHNSTSNYDRDGFIIYQWNNKIIPNEENLKVRNLSKMPNNYELGKKFLEKLNKESLRKTPSNWLDKIFKNADVLIYSEGNEICGWFVLYCNDKCTLKAYCAGLHVLNKFRNKGIAKILLQTAISICKQREFHMISLHCNNPIAEKIYIKQGFKVIYTQAEEKYGGEIYSYLELNVND